MISWKSGTISTWPLNALHKCWVPGIGQRCSTLVLNECTSCIIRCVVALWKLHHSPSPVATSTLTYIRSKITGWTVKQSYGPSEIIQARRHETGLLTRPLELTQWVLGPCPGGFSRKFAIRHPSQLEVHWFSEYSNVVFPGKNPLHLKVAPINYIWGKLKSSLVSPLPIPTHCGIYSQDPKKDLSPITSLSLGNWHH